MTPARKMALKSIGAAVTALATTVVTAIELFTEDDKGIVPFAPPDGATPPVATKKEEPPPAAEPKAPRAKKEKPAEPAKTEPFVCTEKVGERVCIKTTPHGLGEHEFPPSEQPKIRVVPDPKPAEPAKTEPKVEPPKVEEKKAEPAKKEKLSGEDLLTALREAAITYAKKHGKDGLRTVFNKYTKKDLASVPEDKREELLADLTVEAAS